MTLADWLQLAMLCFAGAAAPGLSWLLITHMSIQRGPMAGIAGALGHGAGITLFALLTLYGLQWALSRTPQIAVILNWLGVGLLVILAIQLWRHGPQLMPTISRHRSGFWVGFAMALFNPKVLVFF